MEFWELIEAEIKRGQIRNTDEETIAALESQFRQSDADRQSDHGLND